MWGGPVRRPVGLRAACAPCRSCASRRHRARTPTATPLPPVCPRQRWAIPACPARQPCLGRHLHRDERAGSDEGARLGSLVLVVHTATTSPNCLLSRCLSTQPIEKPGAHITQTSAHRIRMKQDIYAILNNISACPVFPSNTGSTLSCIGRTTHSSRNSTGYRGLLACIVIFFIYKKI